MKERRVERVLKVLAETYPNAECGLRFKDSFQLLIATILSAQSSDEGVNRVTLILWKSYSNCEALAEADLAVLEKIIRPLGLFRAKAKNVQGTAKRIQKLHGGQVPPDLVSLMGCPGVGRKTAWVVLGECFQQPGIVVDTHMGRVARRLGLTQEEDPERVEAALNALVKPAERTIFSHRAIAHGRVLCHARKPACGACPLRNLCPFYRKEGPSPTVAGSVLA